MIEQSFVRTGATRLALAGVPIFFAAAASGQVALSMSFENLESSFDADTSVLATSSVGESTGSVTRRVSGPTQAAFGAGDADFSLELTISNIGGTTADGNGSFTVTDLDGDTFTGDVAGTFNFVPTGPGARGVLFFGGTVDGASFTSDDGTFDGTVGSFDTDFPGNDIFSGALQRLELSAPNFFERSFSGGVAEVDGQFVPAPASLALLGLGGLAATRRRR